MKTSILKLMLVMALLSGTALTACAKHGGPSSVAEITDDSFQKEVMGSDVPVFVDFWATWCGPCRMYGPVVDQISDEYKGKIKVVRVDVDKNPGLASFFKINAIPRSVLLNKGTSVKEWVGYLPYNELKPQLETALAALSKTSTAKN
ncbi:MAG TPA: thioredoxin [bacterium]|nr:thioredoxin [bacterium]